MQTSRSTETLFFIRSKLTLLLSKSWKKSPIEDQRSYYGTFYIKW